MYQLCTIYVIQIMTINGVREMEFVTVRDFQTGTADVWKKLERDGNIILTNDGKPTALMIKYALNCRRQRLYDGR